MINITFFDCTVYWRVVDWFDKLVGYIFGITFLHSLYHIVRLFTFCVYQQVVSLFTMIPTFVTVHCIETSDDALRYDNQSCRKRSQILDKTYRFLGSVSRPSIKQWIKVFFRPYSLDISHSLNRWSNEECTPPLDVSPWNGPFASLFRIRESRNDLRIFHDRTILASTVNLDEVLINYTTCTDIGVTNLRVTHLSVWKTYILTASLQLRVCAGLKRRSR